MLDAALRQISRLFSGGAVTGLSDAQLLERFVTGRDSAAFEALVARHGPMVLSVCRSILTDPNDAEDAFQATFLVLVKKAGTLRGHAALGGWLYLVAHRVALRANATAVKRRAYERRAGQMVATTSAPGPADQDDALRALHEEIARLPEKSRLAVILCDLQGVPQDRAADELRLSERTLRRRLSEGRERLKARLGRRGIALGGAALGTLFLREARAAVPSGWGEAAARAALASMNPTMTAGVVSAAARKLTQEVLRVMLVQKLKLVSLALLGAGLTAWGASAALVSLGDDAPPQAVPAPGPAGKTVAKAAVPPPEPDPLDAVGTFPVQGQVLDPDGKPVPNAKLYVHHYRFDVMASATSNTFPAAQAERAAEAGPDGRFHFDLDKSASDFPYRDWPVWHGAQIVAAAPGYGPAWTGADAVVKGGAAILPLVPDDVPIRGRILDSQGRPQAGVTVYAREIRQDGQPSYSGPTWLGKDGTWTTDAQGRFEIRGVGRDRVVVLEFRSPTLEKTYVYAKARAGLKPSAPQPQSSRSDRMSRFMGQPPEPRLVGADFELAIGPTKPVTGVVRLKGTGKPLAGVHVLGVEPSTWTEVSAVSDAEGRFRLVGLPKAATYEVRVAPRPGVDAFLGTGITVTDTEGLKPIETTLELPKGVIVTGRLVDPATGKAVRAKHVGHLKLPTNSREGGAGLSHSGLVDPTFRITLPPGEGILYANVRGPDTLYTRARLRPEDKGKGVGGSEDEETFRCPLGAYHAYQIINVPEDAESLDIDLELTRGGARKGKLVGPDGAPVTGARCYGVTAGFGQVATLANDAFEAYGLERGHDRLLIFAHKERRLVGSVVLKGNSTSDEPLVVRLEPAGSIKGRLVDEDGLPLAGARLSVMTLDLRGNNLPVGAGGLWPDGETFTADKDGRFQVEGLKPSVQSVVTVQPADRPKDRFTAGDVFSNVTAQPGETRDLGDVRVAPASE